MLSYLWASERSIMALCQQMSYQVYLTQSSQNECVQFLKFGSMSSLPISLPLSHSKSEVNQDLGSMASCRVNFKPPRPTNTKRFHRNPLRTDLGPSWSIECGSRRYTIGLSRGLRGFGNRLVISFINHNQYPPSRNR